MKSPSRQAVSRFVEALGTALFSLAAATLVLIDGRLPSPFSTLFFIPIIFAAYRYPLPIALVIAGAASVFSSPLVGIEGARVDDSVMPVLWVGWPAVYLFLAVSLNQWASIRHHRSQLEAVEKGLVEMSARNDKREQELETLSAIHTTILAGSDQNLVVEEITRWVAEVCGAKICTIMMPASHGRERSLSRSGFEVAVFNHFFPAGAPYGEGVSGWAMLHRRVAASRNVYDDPRYDVLRDFAALTGFTSAAAAPIELDDDVCGALTICYAEERDFTPEEMTRLERLARQTELALRSARQRESLSRFALETALALTEAIESRDPYTGDHCRRLATFASATATMLELPPREIEVVRLGAALHDIGKIVVPDSILKKPDKLTLEEYAIVKQHCYSGGQICKRVGFLMDAYPIVYHHHERWDGRGYPDGLKGERIPLHARIVAVSDAYDAMTTDRPYRDAMPAEEALEILRDGAGAQWDPMVVGVFMQAIEANGNLLLAGDHHQGYTGPAEPREPEQAPGAARSTFR